MDYPTIVNVVLFVLGIAMALLGWFANQIWTGVKELAQDISEIKVDLPKSYVAKADFADGLREVKEMLGKIFDKLDNKVDK